MYLNVNPYISHIILYIYVFNLYECIYRWIHEIDMTPPVDLLWSCGSLLGQGVFEPVLISSWISNSQPWHPRLDSMDWATSTYFEFSWYNDISVYEVCLSIDQDRLWNVRRESTNWWDVDSVAILPYFGVYRSPLQPTKSRSKLNPNWNWQPLYDLDSGCILPAECWDTQQTDHGNAIVAAEARPAPTLGDPSSKGSWAKARAGGLPSCRCCSHYTVCFLPLFSTIVSTCLQLYPSSCTDCL